MEYDLPERAYVAQSYAAAAEVTGTDQLHKLRLELIGWVSRLCSRRESRAVQQNKRKLASRVGQVSPPSSAGADSDGEKRRVRPRHPSIPCTLLKSRTLPLLSCRRQQSIHFIFIPCTSDTLRSRCRHIMASLCSVARQPTLPRGGVTVKCRPHQHNHMLDYFTFETSIRQAMAPRVAHCKSNHVKQNAPHCT